MKPTRIGSMAASGRQSLLKSMLGAFHARLRRMIETARQRRQLAGLSDAQLKDVGLTRADVVAETARPFWRA